jgi:hypothetical protein
MLDGAVLVTRHIVGVDAKGELNGSGRFAHVTAVTGDSSGNAAFYTDMHSRARKHLARRSWWPTRVFFNSLDRFWYADKEEVSVCLLLRDRLSLPTILGD